MKFSTRIDSAATALVRSVREAIKLLATMAFILAGGAAAAHASDQPVKLSFSGVSDTSSNNLQQADTTNDGDNFAGDGTLGAFSAKLVRAVSNNPSPSSTCGAADQLFLRELAAGAYFAFRMAVCSTSISPRKRIASILRPDWRTAL